MSRSNGTHMKNSLLMLGIVGMLSLTLNASAQPYTLEACKNLALENNHQLQSRHLESDMAAQTKREALTHFFPTISATGMVFNANHPTVQMDFTLPVLPTPIPMALAKHGLMGGVTAIQPVFAGGQIYNSNRLARINEDVSHFQTKLTEEEILQQVEEYFWQVISLQERLKTLDAVETQLKRIHQDVEVAVQAGVSTRNDLLRVELREQEIESQRLKVENGISTSKLLLGQYIGCMGRELELVDEGFTTPESPLSIYEEASTAVKRRTEYQLLNKNVEARKFQQRVTVGKNLPNVGVGAGYMYHDLTGQDNQFGVVFASVSLPISAWWGGSHAIKRDKLKVRQAEIERQQNREMMEVEIHQCWNELQEAYKQILLAQKSIDSSTENLRLNNEYFRAGTVSLSDVLDAQTLLQQSRDQHTEACSQYRIKRAQYLRVTGR